MNRLAGKSSASHQKAPADGAEEGPKTLGQENQPPSSSFLPSSIKALGLCKCSGMSMRPRFYGPGSQHKGPTCRLCDLGESGQVPPFSNQFFPFSEHGL